MEERTPFPSLAKRKVPTKKKKPKAKPRVNLGTDVSHNPTPARLFRSPTPPTQPEYSPPNPPRGRREKRAPWFTPHVQNTKNEFAQLYGHLVPPQHRGTAPLPLPPILQRRGPAPPETVLIPPVFERHMSTEESSDVYFSGEENVPSPVAARAFDIIPTFTPSPPSHIETPERPTKKRKKTIRKTLFRS